MFSKEFTEKHLKSIFLHSSIGIVTVDFDGNFLLVNPYFCDMVGYSLEEIRNKKFQDITHPDDLQMDLDLFERVKKREINFYEMEKRYFHKNKSIVWVWLTASVVLNDKDEIDHFVSQVKNITREKELELELEEFKKEELDRLIRLNSEARNYLQCERCAFDQDKKEP